LKLNQWECSLHSEPTDWSLRTGVIQVEPTSKTARQAGVKSD